MFQDDILQTIMARLEQGPAPFLVHARISSD